VTKQTDTMIIHGLGGDLITVMHRTTRSEAGQTDRQPQQKPLAVPSFRVHRDVVYEQNPPTII
jgi:hypothetical protein